MMHGAAHGAGIYLATNSGTSLSYASGNHRFHSRTSTNGFHSKTPPPLLRAQTGNRLTESKNHLVMLALCEVVDHPSLKRGKGAYDGGIWVAPMEETVITRFFFCLRVRGHLWKPC